jgi:hypothetical protein
MLDMTNAAKEFAQYRYGIMCLSNKNLMFAHLTPSEGEKNSITVTPATVTPTPDEKKKISEDLNRLTEFYMNQVDNYVAEKFTIDLTDISAKKSTKKREKKLS